MRIDAALPGGLAAAIRPLNPSAPWLEAWRRLGADSFVANLFYEADFALAAALAFGQDVHLLIVADRNPEAPGARLLALWPFRIDRTRWRGLLPLLVGWRHGVSPLGVPLLDRAEPERALAGLLAAPRALGLPPRLLMQDAPVPGPLSDLIARLGPRTLTTWAHERPVLDLAEPGALVPISGQRRRRLRRALQRLEAVGPVVYETIRDPDALGPALDDYVTLEDAGWKGQAGTSLGLRPREGAFMRAMVTSLGRQGRIRIDRLRREGRTLAVTILARSGTETFCLKVAHDEAETAHGPGIQLLQRLSEDLANQGGLGRVDSCGPPGYQPAALFWTGRRPIAHLLVEAGPDLLFPLVARLEGLRARISLWRARRRDPAAPSSPD